ncbi:cupin domain-containing protein [soil metagenome]
MRSVRLIGASGLQLWPGSDHQPLPFAAMHVSHLDGAEAFVTLDGSTIRELAGRVSLPAGNQSLAEATVPVGGATAEHFHFVSEELYFFTVGSGHLRVGDEYRDVRAGECVVIPPGAVHKLTNTGDEPITLLCCCAPAYSNDDTVLTGG